MTNQVEPDSSVEVVVRATGLVKEFPLGKGLGRKSFRRVKRAVVHAVDDVTFTIRRGETLGLVGESGSGKSTIGRLVAQLDKPTAGTLEVLETSGVTDDDRSTGGARVQMVFQDPASSLDGRMRIRRSVGEPIAASKREERERRVVEAIREVGLDPDIKDRYPHELSGGQAQRVCIARALIGEPSLVVLDEAVSALDVSTQVDILGRLADLQARSKWSALFISHDLKAVRELSNRIAVMYFGQIVEMQTVRDGQVEFLHPYSVALRSAEPVIGERITKPIVLTGELPSAVDVPVGCRFASRCPCVQDKCRKEVPPLVESGPDNWVACHFPGSLSE
jgi:oligopeptide/dipeptide ABC transporter ATP-binding protein